MIHFEAIESIGDQIDSALLINACQAVMDDVQPGEAVDMSLVITDDDTIQSLNRQYRKVDSPTDVLSFSAGDVDPDSGILYLGDVIISFPTAKRQANLNGNLVSAELALLSIHGTLHLFGFDHGSEEEKDRMWAAQKRILSQMGIHLNKLPE